MWSKRIGEEATPIKPISYTGKKSVEWKNQWEYDEWVKAQPWKRGTILTSSYQQDITVAAYPYFVLVLAIVDDYTEVTWTFHNGKPRVFVVGSLSATPMSMEGKNIRFDDGEGFRLLSEKEREWVNKHVVLQNNLQTIYKDLTLI